MNTKSNIFIVKAVSIGAMILLSACIICAGYYENHPNNQLTAYTKELYSALTAIAAFLSAFVAISALQYFLESVEMQKKELEETRFQMEKQNLTTIIFEYKRMLVDIKTKPLTDLEKHRIQNIDKLEESDDDKFPPSVLESLKFNDFLYLYLENLKFITSTRTVETYFQNADSVSMGKSDYLIKYFYAQIESVKNSNLPDPEKKSLFETIFRDISERDKYIYKMHAEHLCKDSEIKEVLKSHI